MEIDFKCAYQGVQLILGLPFVGNKAKARISKRVFHENKACQISRKTNISYPLVRTRPLLAYYRPIKKTERNLKILSPQGLF